MFARFIFALFVSGRIKIYRTGQIQNNLKALELIIKSIYTNSIWANSERAIENPCILQPI